MYVLLIGVHVRAMSYFWKRWYFIPHSSSLRKWGGGTAVMNQNAWRQSSDSFRSILTKKKKIFGAAAYSSEKSLTAWICFSSVAVLTDNNSHIVFCWKCGDIIEKISDREKKKKHTSSKTYLEDRNRIRKKQFTDCLVQFWPSILAIVVPTHMFRTKWWIPDIILFVSLRVIPNSQNDTLHISVPQTTQRTWQNAGVKVK